MVLLKNLFRYHKRLILIFLLTIVLPSLVLSIFGILAIKNEKYLLEKKILEEQQKSMMVLKSQFSNQLKNSEQLLAGSAQMLAFGGKNYKEIRENLNLFMKENQPIDQVFILSGEGKTFFPLLQTSPFVANAPEISLTSIQQNILTRAQRAEFVSQDFGLAISLYRELLNEVSEYNFKAQILNNLARIHKKSGDISRAINTYKRIIEQYPSGLTSSGLPLLVTSEFQIIACYRDSDKNQLAVRNALQLFDKILNWDMNLNEDQFNTYTEMLIEIINESLQKIYTGNENIIREYEILKEKYELRKHQWKVKTNIETEIVSTLKELKNQAGPEAVHFSKRIQGEDYLISALPASYILCIKWNNTKLIQEWLKPIVESLVAGEQLNVVVTDLLGRNLIGKTQVVKDPVAITSEFEGSFPPWQIRIIRPGWNSDMGINLIKSYYFWSILTLLIILVFGTLIIIRTINREREIISIKSDFITSVSHELKTPLTSIRALTERLLAGKVTDNVKMQEYYRVIDQDAGKLTQLVKNILDFSKIESGKKEYSFEITDLREWLSRTIDDFSKDHLNDPTEIRKNFESDIPAVAIDRDALSQCMNNLLDNALKFSTNDRSIQVNLIRQTEFLAIKVQDHGVGISKEDLPKIFDKFFQGTYSNRHYVKGTGLGLAIVKHAIEAHQGRIEVESIQGQGSDFTIFLPIVNSNQ